MWVALTEIQFGNQSHASLSLGAILLSPLKTSLMHQDPVTTLEFPVETKNSHSLTSQHEGKTATLFTPPGVMFTLLTSLFF